MKSLIARSSNLSGGQEQNYLVTGYNYFMNPFVVHQGGLLAQKPAKTSPRID